MITLEEARHNGVQIVRHIGVISTYPNGWTKEVNIVRLDDDRLVYDIRKWSEDKSKFSRGVIFDQHEMEKLKNIITSSEDKAVDSLS